MISPSLIYAKGPPTAASGDIWPMAAPLVAPENLPSVISDTVPFSLGSHTIASVVINISGIPEPLGPS